MASGAPPADLLDLAVKTYEYTNDEIRRLVIEDRRLDVLATEVLGYQWENFHQTMWDFVEGRIDVDESGRLYYRDEPRDGGRDYAIILAPRGWGKSTTMDVLACVLEIVSDANIRILIGAKTDGQAQSFLSEIKLCLEHPRLIEIFGRQRPDSKMGEKGKWNEDEVFVRTRTKIMKEATVTAVGAGGSVVSKHYDLIIGDDLVDDTNSATEGQREKIKQFWYKTLLPTLEPRSPLTPKSGRVRVLGTRYHHEDLYGHFLKNDDFFRGQRTGKDDHPEHFLRISSLDKQGRSRYPAKFSTEYLLRLKKNMGSIIFDSQYQNDISRMTGDIFQYPTFQWYECEDPVEFARDHELWTYEGVDLAIGKKQQNDKFAIVVVGVTADQKIYVLDFFSGKVSYSQQTEQIAYFYDMYDPIRCGIESNAYQMAKVEDIQNNAETQDMRVIPLFTEEDKISRAWKLSAYFERHQIYFRKDHAEELVDQLLEFPNGKYKDLFDALDFAVQLGTAGRVRRRPRSSGKNRPREHRPNKLGVLG